MTGKPDIPHSIMVKHRDLGKSNKIDLNSEQRLFLKDHLDRIILDLVIPGKPPLSSEECDTISERIQKHKDIYFAVTGHEWSP